ncbi:MAG: ABC transporter ATP-binding protein/permease [Anaerolineaceae bacterium]|nr:ABC transporter ATP-binding protein/permease [Anaerolineaceae bacterium]
MSTFYDEEELDDEVDLKSGVLRRLLNLLKPYWLTVLLGILSIAVVSWLDAYFTVLNKRIIDEGIVARDMNAMVRLFWNYGMVILGQVVAFFVMMLSVGIQGERIRYDLRKKLFNHLQKLSLSYFSKTPIGWIMSRVTSDTEKMGDLLTWGIVDSMWALTNISFAIYFMLQLNTQLALIVILSLPLMVIVSFKFRVKIYYHYRKSRKANSKMTASLNENITGVRIVKALLREDQNLQDFKVLSTDMFRESYRAGFLSAIYLPTIQTISAISLVLILWRGGNMVGNSLLSVGTLQAFISYIMFILWPIQDLARVYAEMQNAIASSERVFSLLESQPGVRDRKNLIPVKSLVGDVEFENVSFHYEDDEPVIQNLSFHIPQGQKVALVGTTGGGKTTIVNLLCRFYEPTAGTIRIAGNDYLNYSLDDIQSRIGVVLQIPHLFSGTIRDNLRYGRLDASDEEIEHAAQLAGAHDFIVKFEKGYDSDVGEGGNQLSVGQKQLISIARALLANPDIFVMDEATSSVDTLTEALIQKGMRQLMTGRTSFIIAHRLSTIKSSDQIFVIEEGQIVESGSHKSLIRQRGVYYNLYTKQFRQDLETKLDPFAEAGAEANPA